MSTISDSHRRRLQRDPFAPVRVEGDGAEEPPYLLSALMFRSIAPQIPPTTFEPTDVASHNAKSAAAAGWNNPVMNDYDNYDHVIASS